jgi:hypothetical protein
LVQRSEGAGFIHGDLGAFDSLLRHLFQSAELEGAKDMNDTMLLYLGMFCFGMTVLGMVLTYFEFRKMSRTPDTEAYRGAATTSETIKTPSIAKIR